jgi:sec-independent protein translocase protein TatC
MENTEIVEIKEEQEEKSKLEKYIKSAQTKYSPFLLDLHKRLYRVAIFFIIFFISGFFFSGFLIRKVLLLMNLSNVTVIATSPFQFASVAMDFGIFVAVILTLPYLLFNIYAFIFPALTKKEKVSFFISIPGSIFLFFLGFFYGFSLLYYGIETLAQLNLALGIQNFWDIQAFISEVFVTSVLLGILFEFPLFLIFLIKLGFMKVDFLIKNRRIALFTIFLFVSLLPPTDGLSLILMSVPLIMLYEITILFNRK